MAGLTRYRARASVAWGIIGTGQMASNFARALQRNSDAALIAVTSRDINHARTFAARFGAKHAYTNFAAMLALPELEVVYISTPNHLHHQHCLAALAAGKAVLCEKPLATTAFEAREIAEAARSAARFCMEGMWTHFVPAVNEMFRMVNDGIIGSPSMVIGSFGMPTNFDPLNRFFDPAKGGGALLDRGCYPISLALRLLGSVSSIMPLVTMSSTGVDEEAAAIIQFSRGGVAQIATSLATSLPNELHICGPLGRLTLHNPIVRPTRLSLVSIPVSDRIKRSESSKMTTQLKSLVRNNRMLSELHRMFSKGTRFIPLDGEGYGHEISEVHSCLNAGALESDTVPLELSIATLSVIDRIREISNLTPGMTFRYSQL